MPESPTGSADYAEQNEPPWVVTGTEGQYEWAWFDDSPRGETYGVRRGDEVICYTNRYKTGYEDAVKIAAAMNAAQVWL